MGNFEKLSVLVIVVIIVMILVVALYTWQDTGDATTGQGGPSNDGTELNAHGATDVVDTDRPEELWPEGPLDPLVVDPQEPTPLYESDPEIVDPRVDVIDPIDNGESEEPAVTPPVSGGENDIDVSRTESWSYAIQSGDTLSQISERELGTVRRQGEIKTLNPAVDWLRIRPGQMIKMPPRGAIVTPAGPSPRENAPNAGRSSSTITPGEYYVSVAGDTIQSISKRAYNTVERWPGLWASNLTVVPSIDAPLKSGTRIFIPAK